ncbi:MAG: hypothetical protein IKF68_08275 [Erysipelotrichaceae bacterium]|nr:hypothetical protein [Erysipelotrichaceae bacterium]
MDLKALVKSIISTLAFIYLTKAISYTGIFSLFIMAVLYFAYSAIETDRNIFVKLGAAVFGIFAVLNCFQVNVYDEVLGIYTTASKVLIILLIFAGVYLFMEAVLSLLYHLFDLEREEGEMKFSPNRLFIISFIALIIIYLPVWLMEYPSNISPDTIDQINQILSGVYRNHHPFAHTMWLKLLMSFSDEINLRVGIAALLQLIINSAVFSLVIRKVYVKTKKLFYGILTFLFYSVLSFHAFYSITLIKDVTHATIACLLLMSLIDYFDSEGKKKTVALVLTAVFSLCFCLFRSNGYYAFVITIIFAFVYMFMKKDYKLIISMVLVFILATVIKGPVYTSMGISKASSVESLSVPVQQIALTVKNGKELTKEERQLLNKVVDVSKLNEAYDVFLSDPVKNLYNERGNLRYLSDNKMAYLKMWIDIGMRNPLEYIQAWVNQCSGYFSPHYYSTSIFWSVWENSFGVKANRLLIPKEVSSVLHDLAYYQHEIPLLGWLHYPSVTTWILIVLFFYGLRNRDMETVIVISPLAGIFLTLLISCPFNLCFRYYYAAVAVLPLVCLKALKKGREEA